MIEHLDTSWKEILRDEFNQDYFKDLSNYVKQERITQTIYPTPELCFSAFNKTKFKDVKVVLIGQDPYHNIGQANGLCFSVSSKSKIPPSLKNIFNELKTDLNCAMPLHGNLEKWAEQGVLLLNATLSVRAHKPGSHQKKGWEQFTNKVIQLISEECKNIVFILWGNYAQKKIDQIDENRHLILKSVHPSPFSARKGFFGSKPFTKTNNYLTSFGKEKINWDLNSDNTQRTLF